RAGGTQQEERALHRAPRLPQNGAARVDSPGEGEPMSKAKAVRRTIRRLLLAAPAVQLFSCGPLDVKRTFPLSEAVFADGGTDTSTDCTELCKTIVLHQMYTGGTFSTIKGCMFTTTDGGMPGVFCEFTLPAEGRLPPGEVQWRSALGAHPVGLLFAGAT